MLTFNKKPSVDVNKNGELRIFFEKRKYNFILNVDLNKWYNISIEQRPTNEKVRKKFKSKLRLYVRFISPLQLMEERFTVLRILNPSHSSMLECFLETNPSQPLMPATEICIGRTFMLTTALILGLKYKGTRRLEQLTVGVHSSVSVLI